MSFVKVESDGSLTFPYNLRLLKSDNRQKSFDSNIFNDTASLRDLDIYPVIDQPPSLTDDQTSRRNGVEIRDGQYYIRYETSLRPSELEGGTREPTSEELDTNREVSALYYMDKVQKHIDNVVASYRFGHVQTDPRTGQRYFQGDINNAAKYTSDTGTTGSVARQLLEWNAQVWMAMRVIESQWLREVDPIDAPTWTELLAQLPPPSINVGG